MCEEKPNQERRTIIDGIGDMVEEMNQTVRTTVEKGAAHAERLGENLKESIQGMRAGRDNVVMVRIDDASKSKLDELLDAGLVNSRSEAAAFLIAEGIKSRSQLFDTISGKVEDIRKKKRSFADCWRKTARLHLLRKRPPKVQCLKAPSKPNEFAGEPSPSSWINNIFARVRQKATTPRQAG